MKKKSPKLIWGLMSVGIYFATVGALIFYFNTRNEKKSVHYVKKNENRIQVALHTPKKEKMIKSKPKKLISQSKVKQKSKPKDIKKKVIQEKIVKKLAIKKDVNKTKPQKQTVKKANKPKVKKTSELFSKIKTEEKKLKMQITDKPIKSVTKKNIIKISEKHLSASERVSSTLKMSDSGVENAYFAKVQSMLEDWPAQSDFAGEKATVILYIEPSGRFKFRIKSGSSIEDFNTGLMGFLEQLQTIGFGRHNAGRTYEFEAEFIAKE